MNSVLINSSEVLKHYGLVREGWLILFLKPRTICELPHTLSFVNTELFFTGYRGISNRSFSKTLCKLAGIKRRWWGAYPKIRVRFYNKPCKEDYGRDTISEWVDKIRVTLAGK